MKKLLNYSALFITASILFSSCASNFSVMKRHYNSGYYVDYSKNTPTTIAQKVTAKTTPTQITPSVPTEQPKATISSQLAQSDKNTKAVTNVIVANTKKMKTKAILSALAKQSSSTSIAKMEGTAVQAKSFAPETVTMSTKTNEGGHISVLLLIIIIILAICLLDAILAGLGPLLYLLFLVALILFILWILKIVSF